MNKKGLVLLSGGLDSILAARMMLEQGVELEAINFATIFHALRAEGDEGDARRAARALGIRLKVVDITDEHPDIVKKPKHGYGGNLNPCIDCRIFTFKKAKAYMEEIGASFIVTGEVLGERPMSQRADAMRLIERESGMKGLIVRPLSAKLLDPTEAEKAGIVDREKLLDIQGRSRKPQMELARQFGIKEYPAPAGGCLLTDPGFSKRMRDLMAHDAFTLDNIRLLKIGRHFRLDTKTKLVVGRNKDENGRIQRLARPGDILLDVKGAPSPLALLRGNGVSSEGLAVSGSVLSRYSDGSRREVEVLYWEHPDGIKGTLKAPPATKETLFILRIT